MRLIMASLALLVAAVPARARAADPADLRQGETAQAGVGVRAGQAGVPEPAADAPVEAAVLKVDGPDLFVDLGRARGATAGQEIRILQVVEVRRPGSRQVLEDTFLVGIGRIREAGEVLSRIEVDPELAAVVRVGDRVRLVPPPHAGFDRSQGGVRLIEWEGPAPSDPRMQARAQGQPGAGQPCPAAAVAPPDPEVQALRATFVIAAGADPETRIAAWRDFARTHPRSDLASHARREVEALERDLAARKAAAPLVAPRLSAASPVEVPLGEQVTVTAAVDRPRSVHEAVLHYRAAGSLPYHVQTMDRVGDTAFAARLPDALVTPEGAEWYVTAVDTQGREHGGAESSAQGVVRARPPAVRPPLAGRSQVALAFEYADFYRFENVDAYGIFTADFLYRIRAPGEAPQHLSLYAVRVGYGAFGGVGASVADLDAARTVDARRALAEPVGFNFGYTELELRTQENLGFMLRGIVGIDHEGLDVGGQVRMRLGPEKGTNLLLGALTLGDIGQSYLLQLAWDTVPNVPMSGAVEVTTYPVRGDDVGVRLIYEARYQLTEWFGLGGRIGYGLRNIEHGGLSVGLGTVFSW